MTNNDPLKGLAASTTTGMPGERVMPKPNKAEQAEMKAFKKQVADLTKKSEAVKKKASKLTFLDKLLGNEEHDPHLKRAGMALGAQIASDPNGANFGRAWDAGMASYDKSAATAAAKGIAKNKHQIELAKLNVERAKVGQEGNKQMNTMKKAAMQTALDAVLKPMGDQGFNYMELIREGGLGKLPENIMEKVRQEYMKTLPIMVAGLTVPRATVNADTGAVSKT